MNDYTDYILFHQTPAQLRRIGARGGKACARNRRALPPACRETEAPDLPPVETTAQALAALDAGCPWLRGAETRRSRRMLPRASRC